MSKISGWSEEISARLKRIQPPSQFDNVSIESDSFHEEKEFGSISPFPSATSCSGLNPLFFEDPELELLTSPFPLAQLNFDLPDPKPENQEEVMASIREQNGQVEGAVGGTAPSNIVYPVPEEGKTNDFVLKSGFLHHLPKFHGLSGEDPNQHLTLFQFNCETMCPRGADIQIVKMRAFPYSLEDRAQKWLFEVPAGRITSWTTMVNEFLSKYFPSSRVTHIRKQITGIKQGPDESFYNYYERFRSLIASCPAHGIREGLLLQYFYEGLLQMEKEFLDSAAGGSFLDKSNVMAKDLLEKRAMNNQQFGTSASATRQVHETHSSSNSALEDKVDKLSKMMTHFMKTSGAQVCGICTEGHPTDQCPQVASSGGYEEVNALGYQGGQRYNPYSNTYNHGQRDHPNFRWSNNENVLRPHQNKMQFGPRPGGLFRPQAPLLNVPPPNVAAAPNYDELLKSLAAGQSQLNTVTQTLVVGQQANSKDIAELKTHMGQVVDFMGRFSEQGKLPSGVIPNPRNEQAQAIMTRSGLELKESPNVAKKAQTAHDHKSDEIPMMMDLEKDPATSKKEMVPPHDAPKGTIANSSGLVKTNHVSCVPFPSRFTKSKKDKSDEEVLEVFRKVEVNLPLLECIKQIPKYAKFLKELCTSRRKTREEKVVKMNETVSAVIQRKLPPKMKDPGSFSVPCKIGNTLFNNVMLDLGASINVMPYNVYQSLGLGPLKNDNVIIQLADRSNKYPKGYVEDVLVQVSHLIFPADFYVLDMEVSPLETTPLLLGRPFMRTARTCIDVANGSLTMEFDGNVISFNIFEVMKYPISDINSCFSVDDSIAQVMSETLEA